MSQEEQNIPGQQRGSVVDNLFRHLLYLIATGKWPEGMKLPSVREAERVFGTSRTTVQQTYQRLVAHELVESKPKSGYTVKKQSANAWISRYRGELKSLYQDFSEAVWRSTGLTPLPVFRYLSRLAEILDHAHPSCALVECTSLQAGSLAKEIKDRLGISVLPMTVQQVTGNGMTFPPHVKFVVTTHFHQAELLPLRSRYGLEVLAVPIEASLSIREKLAHVKGKVVFLETERQMAEDITDDVQKLLTGMPVSKFIVMTVENIPKTLHKLLGDTTRRREHRTTVLLSPRDWGSLDDAWRNHPGVGVITYSIREHAWNAIAEFLGMPLGPLG